MGFWNSVIYITTSWAAVRMLFSGKLSGEIAVKKSSMAFNTRPGLGSRRRTRSESGSMTKLAPVGKGGEYDQMA